MDGGVIGLRRLVQTHSRMEQSGAGASVQRRPFLGGLVRIDCAFLIYENHKAKGIQLPFAFAYSDKRTMLIMWLVATTGNQS